MKEKKKKIAIVIDRLNTGGVEKIAIEEVKSLRSLGEEAYLVILRRDGVVPDAFKDLRKNLPTIFLDDRLPSLLKFSFRFPIFRFFSFFHISYPLFIPFVLKKNEFDFIICHSTYTCFTAIMIKKIKGISYAAFIWDPIGYILVRVYDNSFNAVANKIFTKIANFLDKVIVSNAKYTLVGGDAHNDYLNSMGANIKIIHPSAHLTSKPSRVKKDYVVMVTGWRRGKNPEYIAKILKVIKDLQIVMVGNWNEKEYLDEFKEFIDNQGVKDNISIVGKVNEKELINYYKNALFVLQTNDDRGFGMPALEAASCGTTFIIPQNQGVCALFENKVDGFYTRYHDTKSIINLINKLRLNRKLALEMGYRAWLKVKDNYSWEKHAEQLVEVVYS